MDNNRLNALLKRDTDTAAGLLADQANYQLLEADMAPLRTEHAANLALARDLEADVMADAQDDATQQKTSARRQLKALGTRLAAALQAHAASTANTDEDLAGRVNYNRTDLNRADDATFATIIGTLLREPQPLAAQLEKREITADDLALVAGLLLRFNQKHTRQHTAVVAGSTSRKTLIALLAPQHRPHQENARAAAPLQRFAHPARRLAALSGLHQSHRAGPGRPLKQPEVAAPSLKIRLN